MSKDVNKKEEHHAPGSLVLALVFLAVFIFFFAVNYGLLSRAWPVR